MEQRHRVVIVGGGFGGLACARALRNCPVEVVLIDRENHHLFQPLLYQVATGELSPANIAAPLRAILRKQTDCLTLMGEVVGIDPVRRKVLLKGSEVPYETLVLAAGARHSYFGNDHWEQYAPGLKTIQQATQIRARILYAFEAAEAEEFTERRQEWLTFVIVGAGPTGVELAGALSEISRHMLKHDFRRIRPESARILLVEASPRPLAMYPESLSQKALCDLQKLGIEVRTATRVTEIEEGRVRLAHGDHEEWLGTRTVIWAAGVAGSPLGKQLAEATGAELDRVGRLLVQPDLTLPNHPEIFVIGDMAHCLTPEGNPLPGLAPVAMQQGNYVARLIRKRLQPASTAVVPPFRYRDRGSMAVIGRYRAVALVGKRRLSGLSAWLVWLFIHLMEITQFRNRLLVLMQWGWTYFTHDRSARLITGTENLPPERQENGRPADE